MIGREAELARATHALATGRGVAHGALVTGPIGSGVSMLLVHASAEHGNAGGRALQLTADGAVELLGGDLAAAMAQVQRLSPTAIVVDDVHLLPPATATLLRAVVANAGVPFLGGVHPVTDAGVRTAHSLAAGGALAEIHLEPLPLPLIGALCAELVEGRVHSATVQEVARRCGGWPGLAADLVRAALAAGALREASGLYRFVSPVGLPAVTARRLGAVVAGWPHRHVDTLTSIALSGRLPGRAADLPPAVAASGLVAERNGALEPAVPLLAEAAIAATPTPRLRKVATRLLAEMPDDDLVRLVDVQVAAGRTPSPAAFTEAARWARERGDLWAAARLLAAAPRDGGRDPAIRVLAIEVAQESGDVPHAAALLTEVIDDEATDPVTRAFAMSELASMQLWDLGQPDAAIRLGNEMAALAAGTPWTNAAHGVLGTMLLYAGRPGDAVTLLDDLGDENHPSIISGAASALLLTGRCRPAVVEAERAFDRRRSMSEEAGLPGIEVYANALMLAYAEAGDLGAAAEVPGTLPPATTTTGGRLGWMALATARVLLLRGELEAARDKAGEATISFADLDRRAPLRWAMAATVVASAHLGQIADAAAAMAALERLGPPSVRFLETDIERARAWLLAARGDLVTARSVLGAAAAEAERVGAVMLAMTAWHDIVRLGGSPEALDGVRRLALVVDSAWTPPRLAHAEALAGRDAAALLQAAEEFAALGAWLHAREAATQAAGCARAAGERAVAQRASALALTAADHCPHARTPALRDAAAAALTPREREVAELVARGRTSKEAAATLGISPRTVENMLQRVYLKLDIPDRVALAALLAG